MANEEQLTTQLLRGHATPKPIQPPKNCGKTVGAMIASSQKWYTLKRSEVSLGEEYAGISLWLASSIQVSNC